MRSHDVVVGNFFIHSDVVTVYSRSHRQADGFVGFFYKKVKGLRDLNWRRIRVSSWTTT